jgi:hypothetical protein
MGSENIDMSMYKVIVTGVQGNGLKRHFYRPTEKSVDKDIPIGVQSEKCTQAIL